MLKYLRFYQDYQDLEQSDWNPDVDPSASKGQDDFDVVIIGSGIGGLGCGALLAGWHYKVLVLEHHFQVGGYYGSFRRKGFMFNTGAVEVTGLWEKGPFRLFLEQLGLNWERFFTRNRYQYILGDRQIFWTESAENFFSQLAQAYPEEKEALHTFVRDARRAHDQRFDDTQRFGVPLPPSIRIKLFGESGFFEHLEKTPVSHDWMGKTIRQKLDEYFSREELKVEIDGLMSHLAGQPDIPADVILRHFGFFLHGSYFPRGGAQKLSDALKDFIETSGGLVLVNHRAEEIITKDGCVKGVRAGDRIFNCPAVVSNSDAKNTFLSMVDRRELETDFARSIEKMKMTESGFLVFLGVDLDTSGYPTLLTGMGDGPDEFIHITFNSSADPCYAPGSQSSLVLFDGASYPECPSRGTKEYKAWKQKKADSLIELAEKFVPGLKENIVVMDAATPRTFERYTLITEGAIEAEDGSIHTLRPGFKTPIKGLYIAGASTYPGSGLELCLMSGIICANDIRGWKAWRF